MPENSSLYTPDELDLILISALRENAKLSNKELAEKIGLSITPTYERVKRLENWGIITCYRATIDQKMLGKNLLVSCQIQLKNHDTKSIKEFEKKMQNIDEVEQAHHVTGNFDYLLFIRVNDMESYEKFLRKKLAGLPHIANVQSHFVMRTLKED